MRNSSFFFSIFIFFQFYKKVRGVERGVVGGGERKRKRGGNKDRGEGRGRNRREVSMERGKYFVRVCESGLQQKRGNMAVDWNSSYDESE
jgi:hypothetical protein